MNNSTDSDLFYDEPLPGQAPLHVIIPMTVLYSATFIISAFGNTVTCIVIVQNSYMHTATNYYLLSLAVSDLLLLVTGLPFELYGFWRPEGEYVFGEAFCVLRGLCAETSTNASILTIVSFSVERYLAICHPLLQHTFSGLSRAVRSIILIWAIALVCALFPALQFGIEFDIDDEGHVLPDTGKCTVVRQVFPHVFEASTVLFFFVPLLVLTLLYVRIGLRLRRHARRSVARASLRGRNSGILSARRAVIRMLVAVVAAFFICWAPFHTQRLMAIYAPVDLSPAHEYSLRCLHYVSGVLYFVSTSINPILYHTMSAKFRRSLRDTFGSTCCGPSCWSGADDEKSDRNVDLTLRVPAMIRCSSFTGDRRPASLQRSSSAVFGRNTAAITAV